MNLSLKLLLGTMMLALLGWAVQRHAAPVVAQTASNDPLSMRVVLLDAAQLPDGDKWNTLLGRPLIALEYTTPRSTGVGGRTLYLYDARRGTCTTVIHAPASGGDPMLVTWQPCK